MPDRSTDRRKPLGPRDSGLPQAGRPDHLLRPHVMPGDGVHRCQNHAVATDERFTLPLYSVTEAARHIDVP